MVFSTPLLHRVSWQGRTHDGVQNLDRRKEVENDHDRRLRRHWRPSLRKYSYPPSKPLSPQRILRSLHKTSASGRNQPNAVTCIYIKLPQELRDIVESFLSPTDRVCLRQTCRQMFSAIYTCPEVRALSPVHRYSLRRRLDRDSFPLLCLLETKRLLPPNLAVCSACLSFHDKKFFYGEDVDCSQPEQRRCFASDDTIVVCKRYKASPSDLRDMLEHLAAGQDGKDLISHVISPERPEICQFTSLKWLIERQSRPYGPNSDYSMFADDRGLTIQQDYHIETRSRGRLVPYNRTMDMFNSNICPHTPLLGARSSLSVVIPPSPMVQRSVTNSYLGSCKVEACPLEFGYFQYEIEEDPQTTELYFRARKPFGWFENLDCKEFWMGMRWTMDLPDYKRRHE